MNLQLDPIRFHSFQWDPGMLGSQQIPMHGIEILPVEAIHCTLQLEGIRHSFPVDLQHLEG